MIFEIHIPSGFINHFEKNFTYNQEYIATELFINLVYESTIEIDTSLSDYPEYQSYNLTLSENQLYKYM